MRAVLVPVALALVLAFSGCIRAPYLPAAEAQMPPRAIYQGGWASLEEAVIRPGVQVYTPMGEGAAACTSNFLFRSPDNRTLYLGVAAHCFGEDPSQAVPVGTVVHVGEIERAGTVAYNGWKHDDSARNDFGLVELRSDALVRSKVNPAVLYFGGPTGLMPASQVTPGTHVLVYGHSPQRAPEDPDNPREGYVLEHSDGRTTVVTDHPGIKGDSGSGLMTLDGQALGVLSMGTTNPSQGLVANRDFPALNFYVDLDQALAFAQAQDPALAGLEVVTAPQLQSGSLPLRTPSL